MSAIWQSFIPDGATSKVARAAYCYFILLLGKIVTKGGLFLKTVAGERCFFYELLFNVLYCYFAV